MSLRSLIATATRSATRTIHGATRRTRLGEIAYDEIIPKSFDSYGVVHHRGTTLRFVEVNSITRYRNRTFSEKEPETLEWIDSFAPHSTFWDIGANVGLYTCYAALSRQSSVVAFEPSVFNLEALARNVYLNSLQEHVCIAPVALGVDCTVAALKLTSTQWGGALSSFSADFGHDGEPLEKAFDYKMIGMSLDRFASDFCLAPPTFLKIDVDGTEHLILEGATGVLSGVSEVLVEINDDFEVQSARSRELLEAAGFALKAKLHSAEVEGGEFGNTYNQIWTRA